MLLLLDLGDLVGILVGARPMLGVPARAQQQALQLAEKPNAGVGGVSHPGGRPPHTPPGALTRASPSPPARSAGGWGDLRRA